MGADQQKDVKSYGVKKAIRTDFWLLFYSLDTNDPSSRLQNLSIKTMQYVILNMN